MKIVRYPGLPWIIAGLALLAALVREISGLPWIRDYPAISQATKWGLVLVGLLLAYLGVDRVVFYCERHKRMRRRVEQAEQRVAEAYQRLEAIFLINQKFVEASDENEVIVLVLRLVVDLLGATGASFVPIDEHGQPQAAVNHGELPFPVLDAWVEYLASPAVRERCRTCDSHARLTTTCPLLKGPFSSAIGIFCLPLKRGEHEYGVLNLFIPNAERLDTQTRAFLGAMMDETALALEGVRLRRREMAAFHQMQDLRQKSDLTALLRDLLNNAHQTLETDFALLVVPQPGDFQERITFTQGNFPSQAQPFVDGILRGVLASAEPVMLGEVTGDSDSSTGIRSLLAAPLFSAEHNAMGVLLAGNHRQKTFHQRHLALLQTIAGQVALVVQNANLLAELEFKTMIQERTRLAREIHDGLAQTLGFLKLQVAQMQNYLARNEFELLQRNIDFCYSTLSEAYQDVRQAIDGLRIGPDQNGLPGWLEQMAEEFQETSGLPVILECAEIHTDLQPEVHAQLIRIVQEALSNIRKHAFADRVWISCGECEEDLWLEIRDNGKGFAPEDITGPSRHGLRGMQERAELIGADFQVASRPQEGTTVRVRMPLIGLQMGEKAL